MFMLCCSTAFLDPEWFTLETANTIIVGMDVVNQNISNSTKPTTTAYATTAGTHKGLTTANTGVYLSNKESRRLERENTRASGIERAAAAATGNMLWSLNIHELYQAWVRLF